MVYKIYTLNKMASYSFSIDQHKYTETFSIRTYTKTTTGYSFQSVGESTDEYGPNGNYKTEIEQAYIIEDSGSVFLLPEVFFFHLKYTSGEKNATDLTFYNEAYILDILYKAREKLKKGGKLFHLQLPLGDRYISKTVYVDDYVDKKTEKPVFDLKYASELRNEKISELEEIIVPEYVVPEYGWKQWVVEVGSGIGQAVRETYG